MGCNSGKQHGEKKAPRKLSDIKSCLRFPSKRKSKSLRPISYAGVNPYYEEHKFLKRPLSMSDDVSYHDLQIETANSSSDNQNIITPNYGTLLHPTSRSSTESIPIISPLYYTEPNILLNTQGCSTDVEFMAISDKSNKSLTEKNEDDVECIDEHNWKYHVPITLEKLRTIPLLKDIVHKYANDEFSYMLNRLLQLEQRDENEEFLEWFFYELEYLMHSLDDDDQYEHKSLFLSSVEQDRYDCMKYLLDHQLLPSKLDINTINDQGRHCLLIMAHKNTPIESIKYLLSGHFSCLDVSKLDFNKSSALHHACRQFNLSLGELLLPYTNKKLLRMENSELHTPLDYWIECLCSLRKLKPTHIQHHSDTLRLDYLLHPSNYHSCVVFFQTMINYGGQLTKTPLRYMRSVLVQLTFEQKLSYVDHHINLCCMLYKNRLSSLLSDYDSLKISIQAGEILTEFIYALGTIQLEIQNRLTASTYSNVYETTVLRIYNENNQDASNNRSRIFEQNNLQLYMRILYFKFFRLFQCIYNNPDVHVKNFHFEHIFRRVWIYWKEPVKAFISQCREKNLSLKSICRIMLFKRLNHYPSDIQDLPINPHLKQFVAYDNPFFVVKRCY